MSELIVVNIFINKQVKIEWKRAILGWRPDK